MSSEHFFLITKSQVWSGISSRLYGYAYTDNEIVFGSKGLAHLEKRRGPQKLTKGRFAGFFVDGDKITVGVDDTGQETIYLFRKHNDWAISNSFMYLAQYAAEYHEINEYGPTINGFFLKSGVHIGEQLISHRTMIKEIELLPTKQDIEINLLSKELTIIDNPLKSGLNLGTASYEELLVETLEVGMGLLGALQTLNIPINLFLSGGYDSRLILGMLLAGKDRLPPNVFVTSHESKAQDFASASNLAKKFHFKLNNFIPPGVNKKASTSDSFKSYLLSCGGTYLPIYPVNFDCQNTNIYFRVTGDQPTGWSHFAGNGPFNGNPEKICGDIVKSLSSRGVGEEVKSEFLATFDLLGIDTQGEYAMLLHYNAIRSRHHCGRNSYKTLGNVFLFTPLMQKAFMSLEIKNAMNGNHPKQVFCDAFTALGEWALNEPFETADRNFGEEFRSKSVFAGEVKLTPRNFEVYGLPSEMFEVEDRIRFYPDFNVGANVDHEEYKTLLERMFYKARFAKSSSYFNSNDYDEALLELKNRGSLSHKYRKLTHIIMTDIVLELVNKSKRNAL